MTLVLLSAEVDIFLLALHVPLIPQLQQLPRLMTVTPAQCHKGGRHRRSDGLGLPFLTLLLTPHDLGQVPFLL